MSSLQTRHATRTVLLTVVVAVALATEGSSARAAQEDPAPASSTSRPRALLPLYGAFAALQVLDVQSTHRALAAGAREINPVFGATGGHRGGMLALKAAATAATIVGTERLWKTNPFAAVVLMAAVNSGYTIVVAHNLRAGRIR